MRAALIFAPPFVIFTFPPMSITKYTIKNKMSLRVALMLVESTLNSILQYLHGCVSSIIDLLS